MALKVNIGGVEKTFKDATEFATAMAEEMARLESEKAAAVAQRDLAVAAQAEAESKAAASAARPSGFSVKLGMKKDKVTPTGAMSIYSCGSRFAINVHLDQWADIVSNLDAIKAFVEANKSRITTMRDVLARYGG